MDLVYLVGAPATGKTTLMRTLTANCERVPVLRPVRHDLLAVDGRLVAAELGGHRAGAFSGTDVMPMNVSPAARAWVAAAEHPLLLGEGDRLAHRGFLDAAADAGYTVTVALLSLPDDVLDARHAARGAAQNEAWRRGRATKAQRLAEYAATAHRLVRLDATHPPAKLDLQLRWDVPALAALPW